jgi:hypothetical protein
MYEAIEDRSVEREIDSDDADYISRCIRENYITGTSCTVVLCGPTTFQRKFVDWEIKATLDKGHGLIGINLPTNQPNVDGQYVVPARLHDNIVSGYAIWSHWSDLTVNSLRRHLEAATEKRATFIRNGQPLKTRNG